MLINIRRWSLLACVAGSLALLITLPLCSQDAAKGEKTAKTETKKAEDATATKTPATKAEEKPEGKAADDKSTATKHKVTAGPLKVEVSLSGVIEASSMQEISVVPKQWAQWMIAEATAQGTRVKKGDVLLKFDTTKIDEALRDSEAGQALAKLTLEQATKDLAILQESVPLDLAIAERTKKMADEDLARYEKIEAELAQKAQEFQLKLAEQILEYNQEELAQLEKMYKADDLTEETEEIVLKRARNDVDQAKFRFEQTKISHERAIQIDLPRTLEAKRNAAKQASLGWEKARTTLPLALSKQKLDLEKLQFDRQKADEKLAELRQDRELMSLTAPADGILYYGRCVRGKWPTTAELSSRLRAGGQVQPREVVMTIVGDGSLSVRAAVPEKELADVQPGGAGVAIPAAFPKSRLPVTVAEVTPIPISDGTFEARLSFSGKWTEPLVAGMACDVKLVPYQKADAITVPAAAVFAEELDDTQRFVYVVKEGKPAKQPVEVGRTSGGKLEITGGLSVGDEILLEKPKE
jgi:multidrug resistance efflux pump